MKRNYDWMDAASEVQLKRDETFVLPEASAVAIWEHLKKADAPDSAKEDALEATRIHLERFLHARAKTRGRVSPAVRRKNAIGISKAVQLVERLVLDADRNARNRFFMSLAESSDITHEKKMKGKRLFKRNIRNMKKAAKSALKVAEAQIMPGRPPTLAAHKRLFCELAETWITNQSVI